MSGTDSWNAGMESIPANPCRFPYVVSALYASSSRKQACWAAAGSRADRSMRCAALSFSRKIVRKRTSPRMRGLPVEAEDLRLVQPHRGPLVRPFDVDLAERLVEQLRELVEQLRRRCLVVLHAELVVGRVDVCVADEERWLERRPPLRDPLHRLDHLRLVRS